MVRKCCVDRYVHALLILPGLKPLANISHSMVRFRHPALLDAFCAARDHELDELRIMCIRRWFRHRWLVVCRMGKEELCWTKGDGDHGGVDCEEDKYCQCYSTNVKGEVEREVTTGFRCTYFVFQLRNVIPLCYDTFQQQQDPRKRTSGTCVFKRGGGSTS